MNSLTEAREQVRNNRPPIRVGQYWVIKDDEGVILRKLRIVCRDPFSLEEKVLIIEEHPAKMKTGRVKGELGRCPELNLRMVFELEDSKCQQ